MAHNTPLSQKGNFAKIRQRQESMVGIAFSGETEIWPLGFGLIVTSNHIHQLVSDDGDRDTIPKSMQMVAGQIGQEYNRKWSQAIAVGSEGYINNIKKELGMKVVYRKTNRVNKEFELREDEFPYNANLPPQSDRLGHNNSHLWSVYH